MLVSCCKTHDLLWYFDGSIFGGRWGVLIYGVVYIREKKQFNLQSVKLTFLSFLQYKARISSFFMPCKMWNMFKVNNKDTKIRKVNNKVKNKDTIDIILPSLLLTLNIFHFLLQCFYCWLSSVNCWLGLLFVIQMFCACWNQFSESFHLWRN